MAVKSKDVFIHKVIEEEAGFHGGNWKIVYADFVTAMMAFFLLMWILNAIEKEVLEGLSNYFQVTDVKQPENSGAGNIFGGITFNEEGRLEVNKHTTALDLDYSLKRQNEAPVKKKGIEPTSTRGSEKTVDSATSNKFKSTKENIQTALKSLPKDMEIFSSTVQVDIVNDTIFIRILDKPEAKYFYPESQTLTKEASEILQLIAVNLIRLENTVYLMGYNDPNTTSSIFRLDLSLKRANEARKEMERVGLDYYRFGRIYGLNSKAVAEGSDSLFTLNRDSAGKTEKEVLRIVLVNREGSDAASGKAQQAPSIFINKERNAKLQATVDEAKKQLKTFTDKAIDVEKAKPAPSEQ